ncbi:TaqI-like C-terminal specificity domain-containing protein [Flavobacterium sp. ZE23DGlu08]|nr:TaqI-like C-terminal specificity domain-containing protein [Flavobacterium sp. ZE23DGlu08]WKL45661.1 TaqI-like C-terminal specificity domain-containing protein [Flavobacterium sp. ZE23DGlu08]
MNTHNGVKEKDIKPVNINEYPSIKKHLDLYLSQLEKRQDKGDTIYNLRNCAYTEDFSKPKIVWAEIARSGNAFTLDKKGYMLSNTGYALTVNGNTEASAEYNNLLAFLNSKAVLFYLDMISTRLDETGWRWLRQYVELLPIPKLDGYKSKIISSEINNELTATSLLGQSKINEFVNNIYGFTEQEIMFLNNLR